MHVDGLRVGSLLVSLALGSFVVCWSATAEAQDQAGDARARLHFQAGSSYFEEGNYEGARQEFLQAYVLSRRPEMLRNLYTVEERLGLFAEASEHLRAYLETVPDDPQRPNLIVRLQNLEQRIARQSANQPSAPQPSTPGPTEPLTSPTALHPATISAWAIGGAGLLGWAVLGPLTLVEQSNVESGCGASVSCTADQVSTLETFALLSDIAMGVGLAGAAIGTILFFTLPPDNEESVSARLSPWGTVNGGGLLIEGTF